MSLFVTSARSVCLIALMLFVNEQFYNNNHFAWFVIVQSLMHDKTSDCSCSRVQRTLAAARGRARRVRYSRPLPQHPHAQGVVLPHGRDACRAAPSQALSVLPLSRQGAGAVKHRIQIIPEHARCPARRCSEFGLIYFEIQCSNVLS